MTDRKPIPRIPNEYDFLDRPRPAYSDDGSAVIEVGGRRIDLNAVPDAFADSTGRQRRMTKAMLVERVAEQSGLSKASAAHAVDAVIASIEDALRDGEDVQFTGFGKFHVAVRGPRKGRNPRTGERMQVSATRVPVFTPATGLKRQVA
jgi:DNA-binding protein HU-beta